MKSIGQHRERNYMTEHLKELKAIAKRLEVDDISSYVLDNPRFEIWTGSGSPTHHHYGKHGLVIHTLEVVKLCFSSKTTLNLTDIHDDELFLSAIFHDIGKVYDYEPTDGLKYETWGCSTHKRMIHHISRSAIMWTQAVALHPKYKKCEDIVLHNILSHHGCREWGSPVMPSGRVSWLLHLCDSISARMNDCVKRDLLYA